MKHLKIPPPKQSIEVIWAYIFPKCANVRKKILVGCFYSPPILGKNGPLVEHLSEVVQMELTKSPDLVIFILGDRNRIDMESLSFVDHSLKQIVTKPTRKKNILEVLLTNSSESYFEPQIIPPIQPDVPGNGVPSDHDGVIVYPKTSTKRVSDKAKKIKIRTFPESKQKLFGQLLAEQNW